MRILLILLSTLFTLNLTAQKNEAKVILTKGQKVKVKTTSSMEADMGMGMEMKNFNSLENNLLVLENEGDQYTLTNTLTTVKMTMDFMGQSTNYDSDKKEDSASEIGKTISTKLNVPDTFNVNKYTTEVKSKTPVVIASEDANPMTGMLESLGNTNNDNLVTESFLYIPKGKKVGDKWIDSSSTKDVKTFKEYTYQAQDKNLATIILNSKVETNTQTEIQGMQVTVSMVMKSTGEVKVDSKTSLVNKRDTKADISGTLEMMGQSVPVTGKGTTSTVYE